MPATRCAAQRDRRNVAARRAGADVLVVDGMPSATALTVEVACTTLSRTGAVRSWQQRWRLAHLVARHRMVFRDRRVCAAVHGRRPRHPGRHRHWRRGNRHAFRARLVRDRSGAWQSPRGSGSLFALLFWLLPLLTGMTPEFSEGYYGARLGSVEARFFLGASRSPTSSSRPGWALGRCTTPISTTRKPRIRTTATCRSRLSGACRAAAGRCRGFAGIAQACAGCPPMPRHAPARLWNRAVPCLRGDRRRWAVLRAMRCRCCDGGWPQPARVHQVVAVRSRHVANGR